MLTILIILGLMALLIGLLGTVYPAIPGLGLMFAGADVYICLFEDAYDFRFVVMTGQ